MAETVLRTAFSLLLLASVTQGHQDGEVLHNKTKEAIVGQNVTLPCIIKNKTELKIVQTEWSKKGKTTTKLALYSQSFGVHLFRPHVNIQIQKNDADMLVGSYLHLREVNISDSGVYICDTTTYPLGSIRSETELKVKDGPEVMCDMTSTLEVTSGENITVHCTVLSGAQYRWTKDEKLVSEHESLELWWVTDAHTGVYTLTVNTGNQQMHQLEFNITVLTQTTSLETGLVTASPQLNITEDGLIQTTMTSYHSFTTSPTTEHPTTDTNITWTTLTVTEMTTDTPAVYNATNITNKEISPTVSLHTSPNTDQSGSSNLSSTLGYGGLVFGSTQEMITDENETEPSTWKVQPENKSITRPQESSTRLGNNTKNSENLGVTPTLSTGDTTRVNVEKDAAGLQSQLLVLIILPVVVFIVLAGFLYKRHTLKKRMDLPPPFKPPPPPIKYSTVRPADPLTSSGSYAATEMRDIKQPFIEI